LWQVAAQNHLAMGWSVQVLVVEDDRNLRRFLSKALREERYGAIKADSGDRALDRSRDIRALAL
jgi:DNA-binding response OmpR family regulator